MRTCEHGCAGCEICTDYEPLRTEAPSDENDAAVLLGKYKKLCMEIKRGDGHHLARIDKAIAALAAAGTAKAKESS